MVSTGGKVMEILKGSKVAESITNGCIEELKTRKRVPQLAIIRVGERPDDVFYERGATKRMAKIGLRCTSYQYDADITNEEFQKAFDAVNADPDVDGILMLRPLPKHLDERLIEKKINPAKDVDGISPMNMAKIYAGDDSGFAPCTPEAVIEMLDYEKIDLTGKRVSIIGRSLVIGKPLAMMLIKKNATVTVCHTRTKNVEEECQKAEIIVAAAGKAKMVTSDYISDGAVVIDVGINVDENGTMCGDVDFDTVSEKTSIITPVPGGVGSVTTSVLAKHLMRAALERE